MQSVMWVLIILMGTMGCAQQGHRGNGAATASAERLTVGYLQLKTPYADAAWAEGKMAGIKKALDNRHSRTGKPYPCWNALKPFHGRNLPVSLRLETPDDPRLEQITQTAGLPVAKLDQAGRDGRFSVASPAARSGYTIWRLDRTYQRLQRTFTRPVIGVVDLSASMRARDKMQTLVGLKNAKVRFEKIYTFSSPRTLRETSLESIALQRPRGRTAIYENLAHVIAQHPGAEIMLVTDGKDTISAQGVQAFLATLTPAKNVIHLVLTGQRIDEGITVLAQASGGLVMRDLLETGTVMEPTIDAVRME